MKSELIEQVKQKMKQTHTGVTSLAALTGIPKARIYKWLDEKAKRPSSPKADDASLLEQWIKGEKIQKVPRETAEDSPNYTIAQLAKAIIIHAETIKSQQHTIRFLAEKAPDITVAPKKAVPSSSMRTMKLKS